MKRWGRVAFRTHQVICCTEPCHQPPAYEVNGRGDETPSDDDKRQLVYFVDELVSEVAGWKRAHRQHERIRVDARASGPHS
jgi:hypothetical protein